MSRAISQNNREERNLKIEEIIIHTGQHYDYNLSEIFIDELQIPQPMYHLGVGSAPHGKMTGMMLPRIENVLLKERPDWIFVYGDTNSTLAGALAAAKVNIPVIHVEAGLRSFNRRMPEEINRILTDRVSSLLFCPTETSVKNLRKEGIVHGVFKVGDVMYDAFLLYKNSALEKSKILNELRLNPGNYCLATVHRQENTDDPLRLLNIFSAFEELATEDLPFIIPLHPRTLKSLHQQMLKVENNPFVRLISPVRYLDMIAMEVNARAIFTDSGGVQKEAFFAHIPCITLREETEWVETVDSGWNHLAAANKETIIEAFKKVLEGPANSRKKIPPDYFGKGNAGAFIMSHLISTSISDFLT